MMRSDSDHGNKKQNDNVEPSDTVDLRQRCRFPVVSVGQCSRCGACIEVAPDIFRINEATGFVEVVQSDTYDEDSVEEAIKWCPEDCIYWER